MIDALLIIIAVVLTVISYQLNRIKHVLFRILEEEFKQEVHGEPDKTITTQIYD